MKKFYGLLLAAAFVLGTVNSVWAVWQQAANVEGTVKSISSNMITIASKSQDGQRIQEISLEVNDQTKLNDLVSVNELKEGDQVKVAYKEEGDKKIATSVAKQTDASGRSDAGSKSL